MNSNYPSGRAGLYIVSDEDTYIWTGQGGYKPTSDTQLLQIDQFIETKGGKTIGQQATGTCEFQNPYLGKPTTLTCSASFSGKVAEFRFNHDGATPAENILPAP